MKFAVSECYLFKEVHTLYFLQIVKYGKVDYVFISKRIDRRESSTEYRSVDIQTMNFTFKQMQVYLHRSVIILYTLIYS